MAHRLIKRTRRPPERLAPTTVVSGSSENTMASKSELALAHKRAAYYHLIWEGKSVKKTRGRLLWHGQKKMRVRRQDLLTDSGLVTG